MFSRLESDAAKYVSAHADSILRALGMSSSDRNRPESIGNARLKLASTSTGRVIRCTNTGSSIIPIPIKSNPTPACGVRVASVIIGTPTRRIDAMRSNTAAIFARRVRSFSGPNPMWS